MKLEKAIEILTDSLMHNTILITPDDKDALKQGVELLERQLEHRDHDPNFTYVPLPGETNDHP